MMSNGEAVIRVNDLTKEFVINHTGVASLKTLMLKRHHVQKKILHVLRGISFEVHHGECLAIVGRNGAGKSTLLSLLAQIYRPTSGTIEIHGRVAPLLELGAGFHFDLTGLENVFVNGMILGISRKELQSRVDSIIEFSELKNHIDLPVRTYSSGMAARLGFSIAVHVDADVLLVDEVLGVGDYDFQGKCAKKIDELKAQGRTIIVVSHGAGDIRRLADRCIWLQDGLIAMEGEPDRVLTAYSERSTNVLMSQREDVVP